MQELFNISKIFNNKVFRIPDYQRGYAWKMRQISDFWEDINTLKKDRNHYMGVLSLAEIPKSEWSEWKDNWIVENRGYTPYFVVDGQQRLITCIILIQSIIEIAIEISCREGKSEEEIFLCDTPINDIRKKFIFIERSNIQRSYIFGYEKDNPSYEFLKTKVFNEFSSSNMHQETLYTQNLENAKKFFKENLESFNHLETIFKKVTQQILFNEYIMKDIDVFVAFETMNNRGKKLSNLELLKNRLIYLTTLYQNDYQEQLELRRRINDAWKQIYSQLGRNKTNPLNDDDFLRDHWIMYFKYSRKTGKDYIHFLLDEHFSPKNVLEKNFVKININEAEEKRDISEDEQNGIDEDLPDSITKKTQSKLTIEDISDYSKSIQEASSKWFLTFNPNWQNIDINTEEKKWLDCLNRIGIGYFRPLVMSAYMKQDIKSEDRIELLKNIERFIFIAFRLSQIKGNYGSSEFYNASRDLYYSKKNIKEVIDILNERLLPIFNEDGTFKLNSFNDFILNKFKYGRKDGFYGWQGLKYFLFEYEKYLFSKSKNITEKIIWDEFRKKEGEKELSIEHIFPQNPNKECWKQIFSGYSIDNLNALTHSLGNLLALSTPKNSSLQNDCYETKRSNKNTTSGYFNGSYSENEVAEKYTQWTPESIKQRGLDLLNFMEKRWNLSLGDENTKIKLLNLEFMNNDMDLA